MRSSWSFWRSVGEEVRWQMWKNRGSFVDAGSVITGSLGDNRRQQGQFQFLVCWQMHGLVHHQPFLTSTPFININGQLN